MGDCKVLEPSEQYVLHKADSGAMRFQLRASRILRPVFIFNSKHDPQKQLYKISIGPVCKIVNLINSEETTSSPEISNANMDEVFIEYWVTWYNKKIRLGIIGQQKPLVIHRYDDNETIGYVQFEMVHANRLAVEWIIEESPVTLKPLPCKIFDGELTWVSMTDNELPPNALIGGFEKELIYVARAYYANSLIPGKYVPATQMAFVPWGNREHSTRQFEILCGYNAKWVKTKHNYIPPDAFIAGYSEVRREPLYVGRAMHDECLVIGKVHTLYKSCYLPYFGKEITVSSYEILTVPKNTYHVNDCTNYDYLNE